ncbi:EamA family transporter [Rhodovibrio sodomensis]|uniref:EamA family transporter n=1 Tax=Rhodovibrio sodomensis TaxID=1088 RepID=A0ABS1DN27_9PROT|nr:DMT family transporter [Rhodovibrio sodomensis]MBK1671411.1 EamA family transporter [Rhodovibrio sodomensis]
MSKDRTTTLAVLLVLGTGSLWGVYWVPVRRLAEIALPGAWGTLLVVTAAALLLSPFGVRGRHRLSEASPLALVAIALGGAAFVLYSAGLVYGRVAIVILLFYLTPVWSTLIGRYYMGWTMSWLRVAAILVGLLGLVLVLGDDTGVPVPTTTGDWLGLASGVLWSVSSTSIRAQANAGPGETAFVFALGALGCAALLAPTLAPWPGLPPTDVWLETAIWVIASGGLWWGLSMAGLLWATARLEPARVGILLMGEVLVGVVSAALFAGERLGPVEALGGALVVSAALMEIWPVRRHRGRQSR